MRSEYRISDFLYGLVPVSNQLPVKLHRLPMKNLKKVRVESADLLRKTHSNEMRFLMESSTAEFLFELGEDGGIIEVYFGDFLHQTIRLGRGIHKISVEIPSRVGEWKEKYGGMSFSMEVVRLVLAVHDCTIVSIPDNVRPVTKENLPKRSFVAYGTSITQGAAASCPSMAYVRQIARNLQCDVINLGVSGNAFCEETIADYIGNELSWDFMTCCVSVNMLHNEVTHLEFKEKIHQFLSIILEKNPNKPIFCISILPYYVDFGLSCDKVLYSTPDEYRMALKEVVDSLNKNENLVYVHGPDVLHDKRGFSCDYIHPNDFGHTEIANNLSDIIRNTIDI